MAEQAVFARRLCGKKLQKFVEERFTVFHYDFRKGLSSSLEKGGPELPRTALNEEENPVDNFVRVSSNVAQELCYDIPKQAFFSGKELSVGSACENGDIQGRLQRPVCSGHSEGTTIGQELPEDKNGETSIVSTASARELAWSLQFGRRVGNINMLNASSTSEAITILKNRQQQGIMIDSYTFVEVLKLCSKQKDLIAAREVHDWIIQNGMDKNSYVTNTLLNVYVKCGRLEDARRVFDGLEKKTVVTWNTMIGGYAKSGHAADALEVFNRMRQAGVQPGELTCLSILRACASPVALKWGKEVHEYVRNAGLESDVRVGTALVQMYAKCGCITEARRVFENLTNRNLVTATVMIGAYAASGSIDDARLVFDGMEKRNVITWNIMIGTYAKSGCGVEAYRLFVQMKREGIVPNAITYMSIMNVSASAGALEWLKEVHSDVLKAGLESDLRVGSVLVHMYAKCGSIDDARRVFDRMGKRDVITWSIMIGAYAESGCGLDAYRLFLQMIREGFKPNAFTYVGILNASATAGALEWVKDVYGHALKAGLESDLRVGTALVHMYAKCGSIDDAQLVFDKMEKRDVVTWNTIIGAYAEIGCGVEAYRLFLQMEREGFQPDAMTYGSILNPSASEGALEWVKQVHSHALQAGLESDLRVGPALVHMYAKSGSIDDARLIFDRMEQREVVLWNIMIGGLAQHGCGHEALELFRKMNADGVKPDGTSFVAVLSACCHAGLLDDGRKLFAAMKQDYGIEPTVVHYTCMVDLLGRAGLLEEAKVFIGDMPVAPDRVTWQAFLGACRTYGYKELGELAAKELLKLEPKNTSA